MAPDRPSRAEPTTRTMLGGLGPGAGALALMAIVLLDLWALGRMPIRGDAGAYFAPLRLRLAEAFSNGVLPTWDTLHDGGTSLWANPQAQLFYPPGLISSMLAPLGATGAVTTLHLLLFAAGLLGLLRHRGYTELAAAPAVLCVGLSGTMLSLTAMQDKLHSLAWVPWILLGASRLLDGKRRAGILMAMSLAAAIVAGGVDVLILCAPLGLGILWEQRRETSRPPGPTLPMVAWIGIGLGLAAVQWLPLLLAMPGSSFSGGDGAEAILSRALQPGDLLGLLAPNLGYHAHLSEYFLPWETTPRAVWLPGIYLGGVGTLFLGIGLARCRADATLRTSGLLLLLFVGLALGPVLPGVGWVLTELPLLSSVRYPQKWLLPALFPAAVLVAEGAHWTGKHGGPRLPVGLAALGLVCVVVGWTGVGPSLARNALLVGQFLFLGGLAAFLWTRSQRASWLALALLGFDLALHNLPLIPRVSPQTFWSPPPVVQALRTLPEPPRLWTWSYMDSGRDPAVPDEAPLHEVLRDNLFSGYAAAYGFALPYGWLSLHPKALEQHFSAVRSLPVPERIQTLRASGVTHVLAHFREEAETLASQPGVELLGIVPSTWNAVSVFAIQDPYPACRMTPEDQTDGPGTTLVVREDRGNALEVEVPQGQEGRVVCLRPWSAGWTATRGTAALPTEAAAGYQLSVPIEPGEDTVLHLKYEVPGARAGMLASSLSLLMMLGMLARPRREDDDA